MIVHIENSRESAVKLVQRHDSSTNGWIQDNMLKPSEQQYQLEHIRGGKSDLKQLSNLQDTGDEM